MGKLWPGKQLPGFVNKVLLNPSLNHRPLSTLFSTITAKSGSCEGDQMAYKPKIRLSAPVSKGSQAAPVLEHNYPNCPFIAGYCFSTFSKICLFYTSF